ncbi:MAG: dTDP-4-dehydrorhamnose reductase [Deltaproteobacteria bacterium GWA2_38_16]|nr:MAG: dTDP-4-dehydrorhamnose reductase [Deltaproteobacteria bacterium GWA2_38_16]OGQ02284.1 MAG: dTDP-4-dehydrorhamnose reductase [Deltaproteobacteria bacterium RIFCSPHIGHO2_02_FULL_38_15]OGQ34331.1 MAG: dTDP-4-dehydrorhamnose reductase [Deltaproteobacteria bacterium RIFCSPLOWO2_01_FULL_38_9]OGQ60494.1 MAG: dTDP-4-dehydrorhamnose reductase [Deltaproteobacteria bacterium RIFCSPLOWO2_12_FULL_38_8]HBQ22050.1 dTDP-4-dehydrorhamnose reductase [Deltaproteobacteria bacterium]
MVEKSKQQKILVIGSTGLLGSEIVQVLSKVSSYEVKGASHAELDITNGMEVAIWLERLHPDIVINCAALSNVDYCEEHPEEAFKVNSEGVRNICLPLEENGGKLIHFSTDYVFDGEKGKPYVETDPVNPLNYYAQSKLKSEEYVKKHLPNSIIARVQWLYGEHGKNFASSVIQDITFKNNKKLYRFIKDRVGSPTRVTEIALAMRALIDQNKSGTYHVAASGECSWDQFAQTVCELNGITDTSSIVQVMMEQESGRSAKRPAYSVLSSRLLESEIDIKMPLWKKTVEDTIRNLRKNCNSPK